MHDFFVYRDAQRSFESFGAYTPITINVSGDERPERVEPVRISSTALSLTHVRPELGRLFHPDDETPGGELVVILSHAFWRDHYALDSSVVGRAIRVNGQPATVVGVMPEGFRYPNEAKLWVPLRLDPASMPWDSSPYLSAVGLVFLVACTNVANLLLGRAAHRSREVAIRSALGARAPDVMRLVLRGGAIQLLAGVGIGVLLGIGGARLARAVLFGVQPGDPTTIAAAIATLAATGFAACLAPALRATKADPVRSLRAE